MTEPNRDEAALVDGDATGCPSDHYEVGFHPADLLRPPARDAAGTTGAAAECAAAECAAAECAAPLEVVDAGIEIRCGEDGGGDRIVDAHHVDVTMDTVETLSHDSGGGAVPLGLTVRKTSTTRVDAELRKAAGCGDALWCAFPNLEPLPWSRFAVLTLWAALP